MTDIPLRDQLAERIRRERLGWIGYPEMDAKYSIDLATALLEHFDIQLRSPHPTPEEP